MAENNDKNTLGSALFGAIVGATAVVLLNEDTRKKVKSKIADILETGEHKAGQLSGKVEEKVTEAKKEAHKRIVPQLHEAERKLREQ